MYDVHLKYYTNLTTIQKNKQNYRISWNYIWNKNNYGRNIYNFRAWNLESATIHRSLYIFSSKILLAVQIMASERKVIQLHATTNFLNRRLKLQVSRRESENRRKIDQMTENGLSVRLLRNFPSSIVQNDFSDEQLSELDINGYQQRPSTGRILTLHQQKDLSNVANTGVFHTFYIFKEGNNDRLHQLVCLQCYTLTGQSIKSNWNAKL